MQPNYNSFPPWFFLNFNVVYFYIFMKYSSLNGHLTNVTYLYNKFRYSIPLPPKQYGKPRLAFLYLKLLEGVPVNKKKPPFSMEYSFGWLIKVGIDNLFDFCIIGNVKHFMVLFGIALKWQIKVDSAFTNSVKLYKNLKSYCESCLVLQNKICNFSFWGNITFSRTLISYVLP